MTIEELEQEHSFNFVDEALPKGDTIIKVVGVGGGGGNAISYMYRKSKEKDDGRSTISYALCNTDKQAMNASPVPTKIVLGPSVTKGLGAGNNPKVAAEAAEESVEELTRLFQDGTQMVFITAGMGGGTGTGAAPVVARVAQQLGLLTVGIVTIPFLMEGEKKIIKALNGAKEMSKYVDALLIINNEILVEQFGELDFVTAFAKADDTLANAANSIAEIIYTEGLINLDFKDVETTLRDSGVAVISTGFGEGERRVTAAVQDALNSPLLRNNDIKSSRRILFNIYSSSDAPIKMSEINEFREFTKSISGLDMIYGIAIDNSLGEKVKVSILAAGFKSHVLNSGNNDYKQLQDVVLDFGQEKDLAGKENGEDTPADLMREFYGSEKVHSFQEHEDSKNFIILSRELMENDNILEMLEATPAYKRTEKSAEDIRLGKLKETFDFGSTVQTNTGKGARKNEDDGLIVWG